MDDLLKPAATAFISNLTGAAAPEIKQWSAEIRDDSKFHESIREKRNSIGRNQSAWYYGVDTTLGTILYTLCRIQKPDAVVETGVASGVSSSYVLAALEANRRGNLYSIDLPLWQKIPVGWMIPDYLRFRWNLTRGRSSETIVPLLNRVREIGIFFHDSDHSYENMVHEFESVWAHLKAGGLLLSHNIDYSDAFPDFCHKHKVKGFTLGDMGGIIKS